MSHSRPSTAKIRSTGPETATANADADDIHTHGDLIRDPTGRGINEADRGAIEDVVGDEEDEQHDRELKNGVNEDSLDALEFVLEYGAAQSWLSVGLQLWPGDYYIYCDVSFAATYEKMYRQGRKPGDVTDAPWMESWSPRPRVWLHISTPGVISTVKLNRGSVGACPAYTPPHVASTAGVKVVVPPAAWPFMAESQLEVSSRGLYDMLHRLREESELLAAQFLNAARKARKELKLIESRQN
jgi:hypothetical protein